MNTGPLLAHTGSLSAVQEFFLKIELDSYSASHAGVLPPSGNSDSKCYVWR